MTDQGGPGDRATQVDHEEDARHDARPGSSADKDALVGRLDPRMVARIPRKRLRTYRTLQIVVSPLARLVFRTRRTNHKVVPKRGPVILACNHASWFDPILVVTCIPRPLSALAKSYLFRGWFRTTFFETLGGQIRVDRARRGNLAAVQAAVEALRAGRCIGIWPEGGRSPDGHLTRGKTGVARIALESGAPVIPVAVLGTHRLKAKTSGKIRLGTRTHVVFGEPMTFEEDRGHHEDRAVTRRITDEIMLAIARLMGPDETARYERLLAADVPPGELPLDRKEHDLAEDPAEPAGPRRV